MYDCPSWSSLLFSSASSRVVRLPHSKKHEAALFGSVATHTILLTLAACKASHPESSLWPPSVQQRRFLQRCAGRARDERENDRGERLNDKSSADEHETLLVRFYIAFILYLLFVTTMWISSALSSGPMRLQLLSGKTRACFLYSLLLPQGKFSPLTSPLPRRVSTNCQSLILRGGSQFCRLKPSEPRRAMV